MPRKTDKQYSGPRVFRIYPDGGEIYFTVRVYKSKRSMFRRAGCNGFKAMCRAFTRIDVGKLLIWKCVKPEIGELLFWDDSYRVGICAHEATHAAFQYFNWRKENGFRIRFKDDHDREEAFCTVQGELARQLALAAWNDLTADQRKFRFEWGAVRL